MSWNEEIGEWQLVSLLFPSFVNKKVNIENAKDGNVKDFLMMMIAIPLTSYNLLCCTIASSNKIEDQCP